jgi:integrase/recombinase XerD
MDDLGTLIQSYRLNARIEGKSQKTIDIYTTALTILEKFLKDEGLSTNVNEIGRNEFKRFILFLQRTPAYRNHPYTKQQNRGLTGHTINGYLRAIRAFWNWLEAEDIIMDNPFARIKVPKPPKKVVLPFTDDHVMQMLGVIDTSTPIGHRDGTIILTLLDTGLRASELANLRLVDVNLDQRCLKVMGKGSKERTVPIAGTVQSAIAKYLRRYRPMPASQVADHLFLTRAGKPLSVNRIEAIIENCGRKAGIEGIRCSPHTFRHTFAISYLRNGGNVFALQRVLGHETLDMVRNYVNLTTHDLQAAHEICSPVDNLQLRAGVSLFPKKKRIA